MTSPASQLLEALVGVGGPVLLTGPDQPDGDSIGACLALQRVLRRRGVDVDVAGSASYRYRDLPGVEGMLGDEEIRGAYSAVVVLDGDRHRLMPAIHQAFEAARVKAIVDHHASTRADGYTIHWIDAAGTSTCEMLYWAFAEWGEPLDRPLAQLLYVGAVFDTGGFRYSNTTPATHRMAADLLTWNIDHASLCARILMERQPSGVRIAGSVYRGAELLLDGQLALGAVSRADARDAGMVAGDLEGLVDSLVYVRGVEVAVLLIERDSGVVKASLRSRGGVDVSRVAQTLSQAGGGHAKAAGASLEGPVPAAREQVIEAVRRALA